MGLGLAMQLLTRLRLSLVALTAVVAQALPCLATVPIMGINGDPSPARYRGLNAEQALNLPFEYEQPEWTAKFNRPQVAQLNVPRDGADQKGAGLIARQCNLNSFDSKVITVETRVAYAFCLVLGRLPDATGLQFWMAHLKRPTPVSAMLEGMAGSDEFRILNRLDTLSNDDFITMVYKRFLLREPDGGGAAAYVAELASGRVDRRTIIKGLLESHEFAMRHPVLSAPLQ